ncbi:MAG: hydantoinase/oxoprolinase family protein [Candidatus Syntropharchaeia archaeon]
MILGIDVGGANTKVASSDRSFVCSSYIPLWKNSSLSEFLCKIDGDIVGVVMTGELSDCFKSREEGVTWIANVVKSAFGNVKFLDIHGSFFDDVSKDPRRFSATNWIASCKLLGMEFGDFVFVDVGSTTMDVIPVKDGKIRAGLTDFERLKRGELIYSGVLRTNISCLLRRVRIKGEEYRTSSELFAITADAYLVLGYITEDDYTCETPDSYAFSGKEGKDVNDAMRRIARVVCSDLEEMGEEGVFIIAEQVKNVQIKELVDSLENMRQKYGLERVISAGIGDFIAKEAATLLDLEFISLSSIYGREISAVFPAYAVAKLVEDF